MSIVVAIEEHPENKRRRIIRFDDAPAAELSLEGVLAAGLVPGRELDSAQVVEILHEDALRSAAGDALAFLARKALSEAELRGKLAARGHGAEAIERAVEKCREWRYLDDRRLAERLVAEGIELKHYGPIRLRLKLRDRKIDREVASEIADRVKREGPPQIDQALAALATKRKTWERLDKTTARRRMAGFLQRRGFDFDTVRRALERWGTPLDEEDAAE